MPATKAVSSCPDVRMHQVDKIARMLARLDEATRPEQLDLPGFPPPSTERRSRGVSEHHVRANRRIIFRFEQGDATDVDLVDYH
jgi:proteic killer suppression protein